MIRTRVVVQIEDGKNVYNIGDNVRVSMKSLDGGKSNDEYIGKIVDIQKTVMTISNGDYDYKILHYGCIDKMRFARDGENFMNSWSFDG